MRFRQAKLDNGLTIVAEVNPHAASMAAGFFVRTGSRDEADGVQGVSHFLEHMVFKGTDRRTTHDVNREFDELGANYNAFTSEENTVYYGAVLPEYQQRLVDLLCDILRPALRAEDFEVERNVILDEIARYEDIPRYRVYEMLMAEHFRPHPLGNSVLGTSESIRSMRLEDMRAYFQRRYSPTNVTLAATGNVDFDALTDKAGAMCSSWRALEAPRDSSPARAAGGRTVHADKKVVRQQIALASPAPPGQDAERYAAMLAATIVGDSTGSRLFYALVDPAIADEASTSYDALDGAGAMLTFLSCEPDRAAEALQIALAELKTFRDQGPTEPELLAAKNKISSGATIKGEIPMGRLTAVGFDWVYRREYIPLADQIDTLFRVTCRQVHQVVKDHDLMAVTLTALGPVEAL